MAKMKRMRPEWTLIMMIVVTWILLRSVSAATNHSVGGSSGWDLYSNVQDWSANTTFYVGDSLVFRYTPAHDVLEIDHQAFTACLTSNPISTDSSGETVIQLTRPATRYFMCGRSGHCALGLKFQVDVLRELESSSIETLRRGGGGGGRRPRRAAPSTSPPPQLTPNLPSSPPLTPHLSSPPPDIVFPTPSTDENHTSPTPCACKNPGVAGMISVGRCMDYWWVSDSSLLLLSISLFISGFSFGFFLF